MKWSYLSSQYILSIQCHPFFSFFLFPGKCRPHRTEKYCTACGIAERWGKGNMFCWISAEKFLIFFHQKMEESCSGEFLRDPNVLFWFLNPKDDLFTGYEETDHTTVFEHPNWCLLLGNRFWQMLMKLWIASVKLFWKHIFCLYSVA